ncbi:CRISPR-associated protein Cas2 [Megasphaera cerevisiae DSM 20462]|uniref:CRISPR-associated endoribonuclease Cas2 n=1 Tax=Megasphaera cerevisiae DSM 20462 TaxID=1122219 RepID=A0A0J6WU91_9FIRM|nr:CRISPR-associated endonuclease Cas2 [Megasphaera cerevisiae]KMO85342.1 CRISPR-associated protein Cas2 [Megasphaera cerevisiae DSM 20462]SKA23329.1 CRISPR-associated protein, Cas2 family [Megasphaera cerevisiae DSM 20462]
MDDTQEYEFISTTSKRFIILIIYDIVDNKRRNAMVHFLEKYGLRVQKSAFEAYVTKNKYEKLAQESSEIIDTETDSLRIYLLADHTSVRSWGIGDTHTEDVIIF